MIRLIGVLCVAAMLLGCSRQHESTSRPFRMGFAPYSNQMTVEVDDYLAAKLAVEADIINHRFDSGIPWEEALHDSPFPDAIVSDWALRRALVSAGQKVYVSVTPFNATQNGLAPYEGTQSNPFWSAASFSDDKVRKAYVNYCKRIIEYFRPSYFAMSMEANVLYRNAPDMWPAYLTLHNYVYDELKRLYPDLAVFTTLSGAELLDGFVPGNDHVVQRLAALQVLERSDYYAISFYPVVQKEAMSLSPEDVFHQLFSLSSKPVIVAETAYMAESATVPLEAGVRHIQANPIEQKLFVDALLSASERWKVEFIIWSTLRDLEGSVGDLSAGPSIFRRNAGFYDEDGNPRPALNTWRDYFRRILRERQQ